MQFSNVLLAAAALAVANAVSFTNSAFNGVTAGQPFTFTWTDASGPVTITLKNGASTDLKTVSTIASGQTGTSYTWSVPSTLASDTYAFEINDSTGTPNYSSQFQLIGGAAASASASVSSALSSASSSASSVLSSVASSASISSVASSASSLLSSITAASNATSTASSAAPTSTGASNSTVTTAKPSGSSSTLASSASRTATSASSGTSSAAAAPSSGASEIASPLALVFLTVAALLSLN